MTDTEQPETSTLDTIDEGVQEPQEQAEALVLEDVPLDEADDFEHFDNVVIPDDDEDPDTTFIRTQKERITQPPINDDSLTAGDETYTHDSDFTNDGFAGSGRGYKRSRSDMEVLRRDLHYGQYLEIPKGRRDIFVSRERSTRLKTIIALVLILVLLAAAAYFVVIFLQSQFG